MRKFLSKEKSKSTDQGRSGLERTRRHVSLWTFAIDNELSAPGDCDARNTLQVRHELDFGESCVGEESVDCGLLAVADFECEESAGDEKREGLRDEATIDAEAIVAGEECEVRLMFADFDGECGVVGARDVGWIGYDDVKGLVCNGGEQIAVQKTNIDFIAFRILIGDGQGGL